MTPAEMVDEFNRAFGIQTRETPGLPSGDIEALRSELIREEYEEWKLAAEDGDIVEMARELADIVYVVYGAALAYGINLDAVISAIHQANMRKLGPDGRPVWREDGKLMKPKGWVPADVASVLEITP